jgi:hypothetical protein
LVSLIDSCWFTSLVSSNWSRYICTFI